MTTVYLIRHSVKQSRDSLIYKFKEEKNLSDEKRVLSVIGEKRAETLANKPEFDGVEIIYSSNMARSIGTAKYLANRLDLNINIDDRLNERRYGIENSSEYPDWFVRQYNNKDFKTTNGESQNDVLKRMSEFMSEILKLNEGKTVAVFSHGYAITFYLLKWCKLIDINEDRKLTIKYKDKLIFDDMLNAPEVFKLKFDKDKIVDIDLLKYDDLNYMNVV